MKTKIIGVVGLGLIGGSLAKAIKKYTPHTVYGMDINAETVNAALSGGIIEKVIGFSELKECDLTIICLHPELTVQFLLKHAGDFRSGSTVCDVCGVKKYITDKVERKLHEHGVTYIGTHPMAGREHSGFAHSDADLFVDASLILTPTELTPPQKIRELEDIAEKLGFSKVVFSDPKTHDRIIACTSQLAHIVSGSYIKSPTVREEHGFSAGSFADMTRVAKLDENMWTELFLHNRENLLFEMETLQKHIKEYQTAIEHKDKEKLKELLKESRVLKEQNTNQFKTFPKKTN